MRSPLRLALVAILLGSRSLWAEGTLEVVSSPPAEVYLDTERIGQTPLTASGVAPGDHELLIENPATGETKTYLFHVPRSVHVSKRIEVDFGPAPGTVVYLPPPPPETRRVWTSTQVHYLPLPPPPPPPHYPSRRERAKVHTRNTLLGLTVASQVMSGSHRDRKRFRNVGLGLTVLNELLR